MNAGILYPLSANHTPQTRPVASVGGLPLTPPRRRPSRNAWLAPARRGWAPVAAAATGADAGNDGGLSANPAQKRAEIAANVDRAAQMIGEIVDEVTREMFVSEAVAYLVRDQADQTELAAIRTAVARRVEFLDANFLTALTGFIRACDARGDRQLASLLMNVREEVLRQVAARMPSAAQVLDLALRHADKDARLDLLRTALSGGGSGQAAQAAGASGEPVPAADLDTLSATASKFIDEMEEQAEVLDRRLLARLVLVREELRMLREEGRFTDDGASPEEPVRSNVPQRCAAFLKEVVAVGDPVRRVGLLSRAFQEDWDGAAPRQKPQTAFHAGQPDFVRPGRFMATLQSTVRQLRDDPNAADTPGGGAAKHAAVLSRLELIRGEAMAVLDRMHGGDRAAAEAAGADAVTVGAEPTRVYGAPDGLPNPTEPAAAGQEGSGLDVVEGVPVEDAGSQGFTG
ncbi:hypothetical protein HYH02_001164 [Chlamydomonas schloesseri]|uniref:Uncharacterized protein n=1 Tax=Chlamydomonas schloesseri TaxID=2026947 RepID=A0A835WVU9_9CHLO|nr:hypothetical protein HYH02_001164 [Chlamydomonas schloesseri]|eukprot:KAG2454128.1 hypothetical protein HYH02_001164 [Chlamydomonas schloesseri]